VCIQKKVPDQKTGTASYLTLKYRPNHPSAQKCMGKKMKIRFYLPFSEFCSHMPTAKEPTVRTTKKMMETVNIDIRTSVFLCKYKTPIRIAGFWI
jgi:hypothetical protein